MGKFTGYLLVSDMDATLLTDEHEISSASREAIEYFINNGGRFTVATGRMAAAVKSYMPLLHINAPAILHNGAQIYDFDSDKPLSERFIEEERKRAVKLVHDDIPELGLEIYSEDMIYIYRECFATARFEGRKYTNVVYSLPDTVWQKPWIKVLLIGEREALDKYEPIYHKRYDSGNAVRSGSNFLDVIANDVSKGRGVAELTASLGIDSSRVIAVGDNMNDVSMLKAAGVSYAVENGEAAAKEAADFTAPSNNNSAIAYIIDKLNKKTGV